MPIYCNLYYSKNFSSIVISVEMFLNELINDVVIFSSSKFMMAINNLWISVLIFWIKSVSPFLRTHEPIKLLFLIIWYNLLYIFIRKWNIFKRLKRKDILLYIRYLYQRDIIEQFRIIYYFSRIFFCISHMWNKHQPGNINKRVWAV